MPSMPAIGFGQRIQLDWMADAARLASSDRDIAAVLRERLADSLSVGSAVAWGNRGKAVTILLRTWVRVPPERAGFRDDGLELLERLPEPLHVAVHWAATMAAYPFFGEVAEVIGRLLNLQDEVTASQIQRRLMERFGERETVSRAARRILRTYIDWGVLVETPAKGTYAPAGKIVIDDRSLLAWMTEAVLRASVRGIRPVEDIRRNLGLFPFDLMAFDITTPAANHRLDLFRQGIGEYLVRAL